jgi:hypothetical protein
MRDKAVQILNELSDEINNLYGYVRVEGDNVDEPAINVGPCGPFANTFYHCWNKRFNRKVSIAFIMVKNSDECWHVLVRLPNGLLFDGGFGVHDEQKWKGKFDIEDMKVYNLALLDKRAHGLEREYPRYCPHFSIAKVTTLIEEYLEKIDIKEMP